MSLKNKYRWMAIIVGSFLVFDFWGCRSTDTALEIRNSPLHAQSAYDVSPILSLQAWLLGSAPGRGTKIEPPVGAAGDISNDASGYAGRIYIKIIVHDLSPDSDIESLRRFVKNHDNYSLHSTFGKTERATVEYPRGGGLRQRFAFAVEKITEETRRILLFAEGALDNTQECWWAEIIDLNVNAWGEGQGLSYLGRIFFTAEGDLDLDRPNMLWSPPRQIADARVLK
jgi:hypothetical protein